LKAFSTSIPLFFFLCSLGIYHFSSAQTADTTITISPPDSTLIPEKKEKSDLEGPVKYSAETITFSVDGKKTYLQGKARIEYLNMQLEAGKVFIDWEKNFMRATGVVDSTDSLGNPVYKDLPVFRETGDEPIYGKQLEYNFKDQRGKVFSGKTSMPPGYYQGQTIKKIGKNTLLVKNGYFTSCDSLEHPHFYYKSYQMRIITGKRAMAKPIIMYIEDVPILAVPFGVFPMERGRRSGILIPKFNASSYGGNSLRDFGYYWAASDYWDATLLGNFFEKTGMAFEGELRYTKRYSFAGNLHGRYAPKDVTTGQRIQRWSLDFSHNQTLNETSSINARGSFISDKSFLQDYSHNQQDRLNQMLTTDASFSKRWPAAKNNFTASASRTENLQNGDISYTLPRLAFSHTQSNLFSFNPQTTVKKKWYHELTYNYNSNFLSKGSKKLQTTTGNYQKDQSLGWQHTSGLYFNSKILKYFKYNQNIQFEELWVPRYQQYTFVDSLNNTVADTINQFKARHTFSLGIGASATIYGLFETPFLPVKVIRHKMDPTISFSFSPDFTNPDFGYIQTFKDTLGRTVKRDHFTGNPFGGTSSYESRRMNISLNNLFQGKMIKNGEEKKIDLFYLNFTTAHNFIADSLKWNDLQSSLRASASRDLDFSFTATHSFYKPTSRGTGRRNEFMWENGFEMPRLVNFQLNARVHLAPPANKDKQNAAADSTLIADSLQVPDITVDPITEGLRNFSLPWDLTANFTYSLYKNDINNTRKRFDMNLAARLEITHNWRIQYSAAFNLLDWDVNYQSFNIYRDLHCWEMSLSWGPNPRGYSFFTFEIHVKEQALRDIKLTKSSGGQRVF
jgi:lipopolysaccharide assembly outer membrane protein LptD (OstA)